MVALLLLGACDDVSPEGPEEWHPRSMNLPRIMDMGVGDDEVWAVTTAGDVKGWGRPYCDADGCPAPAEVPWLELGNEAVELESNGLHTVVRHHDGSVSLWEGDLAPVPRPVPLPGNEAAVELAVGLDFLCIRLESGDVWCRDLEGEGSSMLSTKLVLGAPAVGLSAGARHACAMSGAGRVVCWDDPLGSSAPRVESIPLDAPADQISSGGEHSCVVLRSGAVQCWGNGGEKRLGIISGGIGTVPLPEAAIAITTGAEHSCAVTSASGSLYCWGSDDVGQLGAGEDVDMVRRVDLVGHRARTVFTGATARTTFVELEDGGIRGWGLDDAGQMGYGELPDSGETWVVGTLPDIDIYDGPEEE